MKCFNRLIIGAVVSCLALVSLVGCGVPTSEYEALQAENATLVQEKASLAQENTGLEAELERTQSDLASVESDLASVESDLASVESDLASVESDLASVQADYDELNANYMATKNELAEIKEVYPPKDFSSLSELQDWLLTNDVSERPVTEFAEGWYGRALEIQEDALKDGYMISVNLDYGETEDLFYIACVTIIDGDIWWWNPETDEPIQYYGFGKVK